jgi:type I restriction enzyme, S subunit
LAGEDGMKYAAYGQYKPSRIEWLGDVPEHWEIWKIAHGFQMTGSGTTPPSDNPDWYDGDVCWITTSELREKVITDTEKKISWEALKKFSALKIFPEGALAIAMYGATIGRLGIFGIAAATNQACGVLFGQKSFDTKFVFYWLQAFREQIILLASGGGQPNISQEKVRSIRIACPSIDEQQTIARFLDAKTAQIDALVAQKRQLIAKLKEKRSALIARTVTRGLPPEAAKAAGLEPNPEMRSAEVEWLDEYPCAWSLIPLKHLAAIRYGIGEPPEYVDGGVPLIRATNVDAGFIREKGLVRVNPLDISAKRIVWLCEGDVIVVRSGAYTADSARIPAEFAGSIAGFDMVVSPGKIESRFLAYAILSRYFKEGQLDIQKMRAAQPHLNAEELGCSAVCVPPALEQLLIADFLDHETAQIDQLIELAEGVIRSTTEYRQALITSAVTGKIDVRDFASLNGVKDHAPAALS